jgi:hypothetical protein
MSGNRRDPGGPASPQQAETLRREPPVPVPRPAPRDPYAQGEPSGRPAYLAEEGESGRSELWSILKGLGAAVAVILALAWAFSQLH